MKTLFALTIGFFATALLAASSFAGPERIDSKESKIVQPAVEEPCNWTGFYIGAHVGYGFSNLIWTDTDSGGLGSEGGSGDSGPEKLVEHWQDGIIAGGQFGYNYQAGSVVLGVEGDFSYSDVSRTSGVGDDSFDNTFKTRSDWMGSFGFRIGFACQHFLFYGKSGLVVAHQNYSLDHTVLDETGNPVDRFRADDVRYGPMVGGGLEYAINCHWSVKIEYAYLLLGTDDIHGTNVEASVTGPEPESYQVETNPHTVRVGLNYKF